jgi:hypothetical protein
VEGKGHGETHYPFTFAPGDYVLADRGYCHAEAIGQAVRKLAFMTERLNPRRTATLKKSLVGPSPYERAAEIAGKDRNTLLLRRMEDSYFREVLRVTNMLLKLIRRARDK